MDWAFGAVRANAEVAPGVDLNLDSVPELVYLPEVACGLAAGLGVEYVLVEDGLGVEYDLDTDGLGVDRKEDDEERKDDPPRKPPLLNPFANTSPPIKRIVNARINPHNKLKRFINTSPL